MLTFLTIENAAKAPAAHLEQILPEFDHLISQCLGQRRVEDAAGPR